ncbi:MAG: methionine--tRNA ligase [Chthonomonadales bacterium]
MSSGDKTYFITTPIYYVNGRPHIGSALSTLCCDVLARYHKMLGQKVHFLTGTDEQATKVFEAAQKAGVDPQVFVDDLAADFKQSWADLGIEYNDFIRTTEPRHIEAVQEVFRRLQAKGVIYKDLYEGWYCVADETFFRDSDVGPDQLCPNAECRQPLRRMSEENYFFRLSDYGDRLLAHIEANPTFLEPEFRRNEVISFIKQGLRDMSVARPTSGWGIPVPGDPSQVVYVWFDALINYLVSAGWPNDDAKFKEIWPANVHLMGKEIYVRFHATLWPAMLMALDLPLPEQVYAHGWWVDAEGRKGGKRTGGLPHPTDFIHSLETLTGTSMQIARDSLRYLLLREMVFHGDSEYSYEGFLKRYNSDLANDLGNLCNRSVTMVNRYFDGVIPTASRFDPEIAEFAAECVKEYQQALTEFRFNTALEAAWKIVARLNRYIEERLPWKQAKAGETEELAVTLYTCLEAIRIVAVLASPVMPDASKFLLKQIGVGNVDNLTMDSALTTGGLPFGAKVASPEPLFPRINEIPTEMASPDAPVETENKLSEPAEPKVAPVAVVEEPSVEANSYITIDDFMKVELRVGKIVTAEPIPNATKLLKLTVEIAGEERTVLAGIAEMYQPDELVGRLVVVVANLAPRKMRGIESQGMLLAADVDGQAIFLAPETEVPTGSRVR